MESTLALMLLMKLSTSVRAESVPNSSSNVPTIDASHDLLFVMGRKTVPITVMKPTVPVVLISSDAMMVAVLGRTIGVIMILTVQMPVMRWDVTDLTVPLTLSSGTLNRNSSIVLTRLLVFILTGSVMNRMTVGTGLMRRTARTRLLPLVLLTPSNASVASASLSLGSVIGTLIVMMAKTSPWLVMNSGAVMDALMTSSRYDSSLFNCYNFPLHSHEPFLDNFPLHSHELFLDNFPLHSHEPFLVDELIIVVTVQEQ